MRKFLLVAVLLCVSVPAVAQRRGAGARTATLAVSVSDPDGKPIPDVLVTVEGPATRSVRTEGGRIALENLPAGNYRLRFDREGFITLERELAVRVGAPIDVKVMLNPAPAPPPAPEPVPAAPEPAKPMVNAKPVVLDVPDVVDKDWVGRGPSKTTQLSCGTDGASVVMQLKDALMPHEHADTDEIFYVIAGEGNAMVGDTSHRLKAGVFVFVPRGTRHGVGPSGRNPIILLAVRPGDRCK